MIKEKQYDAIDVLTSDIETTAKRIEKGFELYDAGLAKRMIFNGVQTLEKHDEGFEGDWEDDPRMKKYVYKIKQIEHYIVYAHNTEQNAYELGKLCRKYGWKNIAIITSETHIPRAEIIHDELLENRAYLDFIQAEKPGKWPSKKEISKELLARAATDVILCGLHRVNSPETAWQIYNTLACRKKNLSRLGGLAKKILK